MATVEKPPILETPIYVAGAKPTRAEVVAVVEKAKPAMGPIAIALLGALAGYAVPKLMDRFLPGLFEGPEDELENIELEGDEA